MRLAEYLRQTLASNRFVGDAVRVGYFPAGDAVVLAESSSSVSVGA